MMNFAIFHLLIWKYYPPTGVLKPCVKACFPYIHIPDLEVLPAYWGIETIEIARGIDIHQFGNLEVLPAYWGIETSCENSAT